MSIGGSGRVQDPAAGAAPDVLWRRAIWILLAVVLFFRGKLLYLLFYTVVLTYFLSRYVATRAFAALQCTRRLSADRAFPGEEVVVTLELANPSRLPVLWVMASDETTHHLSIASAKKGVVSLGPRETKSWSYHVTARRRGAHAIGPIRLESGDALGLVHLHGQAPVVSTLLVYPRMYALEALGLPSSLPFGEVAVHKRFFADPARTVGTRPYQPGDPYKSIHWKVTARTGHLHVKEYEPTVSVDTMILLNLNAGEYAVQGLDYYSELAIETAASVAGAVVRQRQSVGLATNGRMAGVSGAGAERLVYLAPRKGAAGLTEILEVLAVVACEPGTEFVSLISEVAPRLSWGATLILITPADSPALVGTALRLHRAGFQVIVLIVGFEPVHKAYLYHPPAPGVRFYHVASPSGVEALHMRAG